MTGRRRTPLIIDPSARLRDQAHQALTWAEQQGWLRFLRPLGLPRDERYEIEINGRRRYLPAAIVVPYVVALADLAVAGDLLPDWYATPPTASGGRRT
ncbi:hypothetical protein [Micromonospora sp. NPDC049645]|uniref:hypothetical protein n=1 Tax=Micromonospora sp. NPDC049645 TaxID=3155508 RepID=UPI0034123011